MLLNSISILYFIVKKILPFQCGNWILAENKKKLFFGIDQVL